MTTQLEAGMAPCLLYQCNVILPLDRSKFLIVAWASGKVGLFMPDKRKEKLIYSFPSVFELPEA